MKRLQTIRVSRIWLHNKHQIFANNSKNIVIGCLVTERVCVSHLVSEILRQSREKFSSHRREFSFFFASHRIKFDTTTLDSSELLNYSLSQEMMTQDWKQFPMFNSHRLPRTGLEELEQMYAHMKNLSAPLPNTAGMATNGFFFCFLCKDHKDLSSGMILLYSLPSSNWICVGLRPCNDFLSWHGAPEELSTSHHTSYFRNYRGTRTL